MRALWARMGDRTVIGVIDVRGVSKRYGEKLAVDDLTFWVSPWNGFASYRAYTLALLATAAYLLVRRGA
jgi:hypothetical protein